MTIKENQFFSNLLIYFTNFCDFGKSEYFLHKNKVIKFLSVITTSSLISLVGFSQTVVFSENFDAGPSWTLNVPGGGTNGGSANLWVIDGTQPFSAPNSLHICDGFGICGILGFAAYLVDPGAETDKIAYHNVNIDMSLYPSSDITVNFMWLANGESNVDYGQFGYSTNGGTSFTWLTTKYQLNSSFTLETLTITSAQHSGSGTFRIGFRWINDGNAVGSDPSFNVDNIVLTVPTVVSPPVADFTTSSTTICEGDCINFTDLSTNTPTSWEWSFSGATPDTSNDQDPANICYSTPGNYTVTLVATNGTGSDDTTMTSYITVDPAATAFAGPDTNICDTSSYTITGATIGGGATSLTWTTSGDGTFDDSSLIGAIYTPSAADTAAGCITLTITTDDPAGPCPAVTDSMVLCFFLCEAPVANFTASDTLICVGDSVDFTDLSTNNPTSWFWIFSGGTPGTSTSQNPTVSYSSAGTYTVILNATNTFGSDDTTITGYITVDPCLPVANFTSSNTTICVGDSVIFTDLSTGNPTSWFWIFAGGAPATSSDQNPTVFYNSAGTYAVILNVTNTYGSDDTTFTGYVTVQPPPVANFTTSNTTICEGACINFTDSSANSPTSWFWFFSGSSTVTSTDQNPVNICYPTAGSYDVVLNATSACGSDDTTMINYITVTTCAAPVADFSTNDTLICEGACIDFNDLSTNSPSSWMWYFPGGTPDTSTVQNPTNICFDSVGTYTISLVATNGNGQDSIANIDFIVVDSCPPPVADFSSSDTAICEGACISFTDSSTNATSWSWYFPGGTPATSTDQNPTNICFNTAGTYTISLVATNFSGQDSIAKTNFIIVDSLPVIDIGSMIIDSSTCGNSDGSITGITASGTAPLTFEWVDSSSTVVGGDSLNLRDVPSGSYTLTVTSANGCTSTSGLDTIFDAGAPLAPTAPSPSDYCQGDAIADLTAIAVTGGTLIWYSDVALTDSVGTGSPFASGATVTDTFYVAEMGVCLGPATQVIITVNSCLLPIANFTVNSDTICEGICIVFTDSSTNSPNSWIWSFPGGTPDTSIAQNPTICYNIPGTYDVTLTVTNVNGTDDTTFTNYIQVDSCVPPVLPIAGFAVSSDTICEGICIDFTDLTTNSPTSWNWSFPGGSPLSDTVQNPTVCYATTGTYEVSLIATNANGSDTLIQANYIIVKPLPVIQVTPDEVTIAAGDNVILTASEADTYSWSPTTGLIPTTGDAVTASPTSTTTYIVTGTSNGCSSMDTMTIYVEVVFVPNVLSPNGTGPLDNKVLKVYGSGIESIEFRIYNRWGELVYETNSVNEAMDEGWDGKFKDERLNPATFVYILTVTFKNGNEHSEKGNIALVR